jgi:hypothetical protein
MARTRTETERNDLHSLGCPIHYDCLKTIIEMHVNAVFHLSCFRRSLGIISQ